jgi:hypothetical protein
MFREIVGRVIRGDPVWNRVFNCHRLNVTCNPSLLDRPADRRRLTAKANRTPRSVRLAYQPPANSIFLSEQISHQQSASNTFLSEQISTSHQPPAKRTGCTSGQGHDPPARWSYTDL